MSVDGAMARERAKDAFTQAAYARLVARSMLTCRQA